MKLKNYAHDLDAITIYLKWSFDVFEGIFSTRNMLDFCIKRIKRIKQIFNKIKNHELFDVIHQESLAWPSLSWHTVLAVSTIFYDVENSIIQTIMVIIKLFNNHLLTCKLNRKQNNKTKNKKMHLWPK